MAAPLRALTHPVAWAGLCAACVLLPMAWALVAAAASAGEAGAWLALMQDPQLPRALGLTLWTGLASTTLACAISLLLLRHVFPGATWQKWTARLPALLAVPHAAFAIGLVLLIAPSGWLARMLSPWATGWTAPPPWATTQDPLGLGLIAALVAKEVPFLLWVAASQLHKAGQAQQWQQQWQVARSLGYAAGSAWWRVVAPGIWQAWRAPLLAVLAYSLTVVDMALVIGPTHPPTLAVLTWQWLQDPAPNQQAQGAASAWLLAGVLGALALALEALRRWPVLRTAWRKWLTRGPTLRARRPTRPWPPFASWGLVIALYAAIGATLLFSSVTGYWPFPNLVPQNFSLTAWQAATQSGGTIWHTLLLGVASSATALVWAMAWLELSPRLPPRWAWVGTAVRLGMLLALALPMVLWVYGLHRLSLVWGWDLTLRGVWFAHTLMVLPYTLVALAPAYHGFDVRYAHLCASLGQSRWRFLTRVKWPMLKAALASAFAVGFAVSVAQYLPTLYVGGGRITTVTTEAVALAAGGQRSLAAAHASLQWLLPAVVFALAAWWAQPQNRNST